MILWLNSHLYTIIPHCLTHSSSQHPNSVSPPWFLLIHEKMTNNDYHGITKIDSESFTESISSPYLPLSTPLIDWHVQDQLWLHHSLTSSIIGFIPSTSLENPDKGKTTNLAKGGDLWNEAGYKAIPMRKVTISTINHWKEFQHFFLSSWISLLHYTDDHAILMSCLTSGRSL